MITRRLTPLEARQMVWQLDDRLKNLIMQGGYSKSDMEQVDAIAVSLLDTTNIGAFHYPYSMLLRIRMAVNDALHVFDLEIPPQDTHIMSVHESMTVLAGRYYGSAEYFVNIMRNNSVYNSDEALAKQVLLVVNKGAK